MELLLNLVWLLLALPAWWLWRGRRSAGSFSSWQCLLALGCLLVILFPVVSATDDLRAMRAEMEESPASKRSVRQAANDKPSVWKWQTPPAEIGAIMSLIIRVEGWQPLPALRSSVPTIPAITHAGRAPPFPCSVLA
jgi:hypothetical protein